MKKWPFEPLDFAVRPVADMQREARAFYDRIRRYRTVRDFAPRPVPRDIVEDALRAASSAPCGANMQPWHFVAIADAGLKHRIRAAAEVEEKAFYEHRASEEWLQALAPLGTDANKEFLETAPWLIAVFLKKFTFEKAAGRNKNYYTDESVGSARGFLLVALHFSGLATLTHTPSPMKFLNELLQRPMHERAFMLIVARYPADGARVPVIGKEPLERIATLME